MQKMKEERLQKIEDYNRLRRNIVEVSTKDYNRLRRNIVEVSTLIIIDLGKIL